MKDVCEASRLRDDGGEGARIDGLIVRVPDWAGHSQRKSATSTQTLLSQPHHPISYLSHWERGACAKCNESNPPHMEASELQR